MAPWASLLGGGAYALLQDITGDLIADTARRLADQRASPEGIEGLSAFFEKRPPVRLIKLQPQCLQCFRSMCVCARVRVCGGEGGVRLACDERGEGWRCHARGRARGPASCRLRPGVPCLRPPLLSSHPHRSPGTSCRERWSLASVEPKTPDPSSPSHPTLRPDPINSTECGPIHARYLYTFKSPSSRSRYSLSIKLSTRFFTSVGCGVGSRGACEGEVGEEKGW